MADGIYVKPSPLHVAGEEDTRGPARRPRPVWTLESRGRELARVGRALDLAIALAAALAPVSAAGGRALALGAALAARRLLFRWLAPLVARTPRRSLLIAGGPSLSLALQGALDERIVVAGTVNLARQTVPEVMQLVRERAVDTVALSLGRDPIEKTRELVLACETEGVEVWLLADAVTPMLARVELERAGGRPLIALRTTPPASWRTAVKRALDVVAASLALLVLGPLVLLPAAIAIKLGSQGPILFAQTRVGRFGRRFTMWKLRSMVTNAEKIRLDLAAANDMDGPVFKMRKDPRVTRVGRIIRKLSIDELPQLWNVLAGDMSLVGPRPALPQEVARYRPWQRRRLSVTPGLTCTWQVSGRNRIGFERWMEMDLRYIDDWSLGRDLVLIVRTIPVAVIGYGAS